MLPHVHCCTFLVAAPKAPAHLLFQSEQSVEGEENKQNKREREKHSSSRSRPAWELALQKKSVSWCCRKLSVTTMAVLLYTPNRWCKDHNGLILLHKQRNGNEWLEDKLKSLNSFTDGTFVPMHKRQWSQICVAYPPNTRLPLPAKTTPRVLAETPSKPSRSMACKKEGGKKKEEKKTVVNATFHFELWWQCGHTVTTDEVMKSSQYSRRWDIWNACLLYDTLVKLQPENNTQTCVERLKSWHNERYW